ncbi:MAG: VIT and VWA domain-containing protein [Planctomycetota bacterium]
MHRSRRLVRPRGLSRILAAGVVALAAAAPAAAQLARDVHVVVPQARRVIAPDRQAHIELRSVQVEATARESAATTTIRMTLFNHGRRQQEAQVLLPVPSNAAVRGFHLETLGEDGIATLLPADEARRIYHGIVQSMKDPALLEFAGTGVLRSSVFPVPPGGEQVVSLTYEEVLPADGDRLDYTLLRSADLAIGSTPWSFAMTIEGSRPIAATYSPTHDVAIERLDATRLRVSVSPEAFSGSSGSMRLSWLREPLAKGSIATSFLAYPEGEGGYFMLVAGPPALPEGVAHAAKREVTLVIDKSGSMRGEKLAQAREAARQVIAGLEDGEYFNVIAYSSSVDHFRDGAVAKTSESAAAARAYIDSIQAGGGTNIHDALVAAMRAEPAGDALPMVMFLTDGLPTVGRTSEQEIRDAVASGNTHRRRIFGFGVGYDVNAPLIGAVSRATRGAPTFVLPEQDVEESVSQVFRRLTGPVLAAPVLLPDAITNIHDVLPGTLPDVFEGDQLVVLGRYTSLDDQLRLVLRGRSGDEDRTFEMRFDPDDATVDNAFVPRLWAQRRIAQLVDAVRDAGASGQAEPSTELIDEIVRLSTRWGILTEYTAFLAIEPGVDLDDQLAAIDGRSDFDRIDDPQVALRSQFQVDWERAGRAQDAAGAPGESAVQRRDLFVAENLRRAQRERSGAAGVRQEVQNLVTQQAAQVQANRMETAGGGQLVLTGMRQVHDQTLFARGDRWVDHSLLERAEAKDADVDEIVEFASERYFELAGELARENRLGLLALQADLLLNRGGRTVLVRQAPAARAP